MSESLRPTESTERPCVHCETPLHAEVQFCFECGAPVATDVAAKDTADEQPTAAFAAVSIPPPDALALEAQLEAQLHAGSLKTGESIEIESLGLEVVVDEVSIEIDEPEGVADPHGTVVSMAPERPMPFWPAPPKGETVVAPPPSSDPSPSTG